MRRFILTAAAITLCFSPLATAQTPPEVLAAYKEYNVLLKGDDKAATAKAALKAWELAEEKMGDSKTTGNLAINYANAVPESRKFNKSLVQAYKRAIELSHFQPEETRAQYTADIYYKYAL